MVRVLALASEIILHLVVVAQKIKCQHTLVRLKNQPLSQPGVKVRIAKTFNHELDCRRHLFFPAN